MQWNFTGISATGLSDEAIKRLIDESQLQGNYGYFLYQNTKEESERELFFHQARRIQEEKQIPFVIGIHAARFEDIKKAIYTGAEKVYLDSSSDIKAVQEGFSRFGKAKVEILSTDEDTLMIDMFKEEPMLFSELKKNEDGLVPVITQDYENNQVLMLAYMNEEAYNKTIETGKMTYFSRSRQSLWCKGDTSGHYQYVKSLSIDCDKDTILAKVHQVGAACHTGNRSCFYTDIITTQPDGSNQDDQSSGKLSVLQEVFETILDRKANPKEGSYTNYLFEKGIDKILKKCGEESAEIIIAAKNPDAMELKYEVADYLYHLMVLMAETGLNWDEIMTELANRH